MAYRIQKVYAAEVKAYLDHREINGYSIHHVPVYSSSDASEPIVARAVVYIGAHDNPAYVGPMESTGALAQHIYKSRGPSGENREFVTRLERNLIFRYLYQLAEALRQLCPESKDRHVWDLEERVRELESKDLSKTS